MNEPGWALTSLPASVWFQLYKRTSRTTSWRLLSDRECQCRRGSTQHVTTHTVSHMLLCRSLPLGICQSQRVSVPTWLSIPYTCSWLCASQPSCHLSLFLSRLNASAAFTWSPSRFRILCISSHVSLKSLWRQRFFFFICNCYPHCLFLSLHLPVWSKCMYGPCVVSFLFQLFSACIL